MGIVIISHKKREDDCVGVVYSSIGNINHTGQEHCGVIAYDGQIKKPITHTGLVRELRIPEDYKGFCGMGDVNHYFEDMPMVFNSPNLGKFALVSDSYFTNIDELRKELGGAVLTPYHVEVAGRIISQGNSFPDGIEILASKIKGNYCLGILTEDGESLAARCPLAIKPLMCGENARGHAVITESRALEKNNMSLIRDLDAGEILRVNDSHTLKYAEGWKGRKMKFCSFWHGYFGWVDSTVQGIPINIPRERVGALHAKKDIEMGLKDVVVIGMADSGKAYAEGYRDEYFGRSESKLKELGSKLVELELQLLNINSDKPLESTQLLDEIRRINSIVREINFIKYTEGEIKYPYFIRSYNRPEGIRDIEASEKYSFVQSRVKGRDVVINEDSIRTGNVLKRGPIEKLRNMGARKILLRIGTPKNKAFCRLAPIPKGGDETLIANRLKTDKEMAEFYGVDDIRFPTVEEYVECLTRGTNLTADDLSLGCYTGDFSYLN